MVCRGAELVQARQPPGVERSGEIPYPLSPSGTPMCVLGRPEPQKRNKVGCIDIVG